MPFWSSEKLSKELPNLIENYDKKNVDCCAYTLHVGPEIYVTPDHKDPQPAKTTKIRLEQKQTFTIPAGQFAFLLTEEVVSVPVNAIAFISIKATVKFQGLINISGFHVDPGFKGRLVFSVHNAGPSSIHLERGTALFLIWYADLDRPTEDHKHFEGYTELPSALIKGVTGEILSPQALTNEIKDYKEKINNDMHIFRREITDKVHNIDKMKLKTSVTATIVSLLLFSLVSSIAAYFLRDEIAHLLSPQDSEVHIESRSVQQPLDSKGKSNERP